MKGTHFARFMLFASIITLPAHIIANDNFKSRLVNQSKQNGSDGFYLIRDNILGENDCVNVEGNQKIKPGDSVLLNIKKECKWGVVRYKIFNIKDNKEMGYLGHSFHDGNFSIDITSQCNGSECKFNGLNPDQNKTQ